MKEYYFIKSKCYCDKHFDTLSQVRDFILSLDGNDFLGLDGCYIYRCNVIDDEHDEIDISFCRKINVYIKLSQDGNLCLTCHLTEV